MARLRLFYNTKLATDHSTSQLLAASFSPHTRIRKRTDSLVRIRHDPLRDSRRPFSSSRWWQRTRELEKEVEGWCEVEEKGLWRSPKEIRAIEIQPSSRFQGRVRVEIRRLRNGFATRWRWNGPGILIRRLLFLFSFPWLHLGPTIPERKTGERERRRRGMETRKADGKKERDSRGQCPSNGRPGLLLYPGRPVES